jgi:hypothetical protein
MPELLICMSCHEHGQLKTCSSSQDLLIYKSLFIKSRPCSLH